MNRITLLGLLALAPLAHAGTVVGGRDLTPPAEFITPSTSTQVGTRVHLTPDASGTVFAGRDLTPPPAYISPSTSPRGGTRVLPQTVETPVEDAGTSFDYGDDE